MRKQIQSIVLWPGIRDRTCPYQGAFQSQTFQAETFSVVAARILADSTIAVWHFRLRVVQKMKSWFPSELAKKEQVQWSRAIEQLVKQH